MKDCCENCAYWQKPRDEGVMPDHWRECRRHSPLVAQWPIGRWPQTINTDWCGEFSIREKSR